MLNQDITIGPFTIRPLGRVTINGEKKQQFDILYGNQTLVSDVTVEEGTRAETVKQLDEHVSTAIRMVRDDAEVRYPIRLKNAEGDALAMFFADSSVIPGMTPGLIDDRSAYWLVGADGRRSLDVTLDEYARLRSDHELPARAWIADLLPEDVLTTDSDEWRPPSHWELRHIVGEGSLTGITGAKAAALAGVNPSSFRKYTASEGAKNRQAISFAMWHLLLHRLGIQRLPEGWV